MLHIAENGIQSTSTRNAFLSFSLSMVLIATSFPFHMALKTTPNVPLPTAWRKTTQPQHFTPLLTLVLLCACTFFYSLSSTVHFFTLLKYYSLMATHLNWQKDPNNSNCKTVLQIGNTQYTEEFFYTLQCLLDKILSTFLQAVPEVVRVLPVSCLYETAFARTGETIYPTFSIATVVNLIQRDGTTTDEMT